MNCPVCHTWQLEPRARGESSAAVCSRCGGVWISLTDLEREIQQFAHEQGVALGAVALMEGPGSKSPLRCPQCRSLLRDVTLRAVKVEKCDACSSVFLNPGEEETIARRATRASIDWGQDYEKLLRLMRERWINTPTELP